MAIVTAVARSAGADLGRPRVSRLEERVVGALLALRSATTLCEAGPTWSSGLITHILGSTVV